MSKTIDEFTAKRITFETPLPVATVIARLNEELSKDKAGPKVLEVLWKAETRQDIEEGMQAINGGKDFVLFSAGPHHRWLNTYSGSTSTPEVWLYTFGNPLVAQTMLQHDRYAALHVPPRLVVLEKADHAGTQVIYILPSSLIVVPVGGQVNTELKKAAEALDEKLERLVVKVTSPEQ